MKQIACIPFQQATNRSAFPVPGVDAGDMTDFASEDFCSCKVFRVP